jgi:ComF family protein
MAWQILLFRVEIRAADRPRMAESGQRRSVGSIQSPPGGCQPMLPRSVDRIVDSLGGVLFPPRCILCGQPGQRPCRDLCRDCEASLPDSRARHPLAPPEASGLAVSPIDRCYARYAYGFPVDHLVHSLKYRGQLATGRVLGALLADGVKALGLHLDVDWLLPVPLHPGRHAERGFNQAAELAHWAGRALGRPVVHGVLLRTRDTRPQVGLRFDERHANIRGAFGANACVRGRRIVVVDDVLTTGSTIAAAAAAVLDAGAATVDAWCIARADPNQQVHWAPRKEASSA